MYVTSINNVLLWSHSSPLHDDFALQPLLMCRCPIICILTLGRRTVRIVYNCLLRVPTSQLIIPGHLGSILILTVRSNSSLGRYCQLLVSLEINSFNISSCQIHYSNYYGNHSCITGIYLYYWLIRPYQWLVGLGCESNLLPWYVIDWFCFVVVIAISSVIYHQCSFRLDQWLIESI